ncbi:MAG: AAA family ATPase [Acidimicrobiaceae bacterium]|nr:AAA family ATPase [Acidimicrobiaceae bacterium]MCY4279739.1 AAA family ATPase [Acidimicrobiaceae bacterium]MCY4293943.1 AAA family ATPase [Acidimicrobiaceae bacterium]
MTTVAFFNNKGGVGKTSLVYHLAWMYADLGLSVVAADLDPQANLTSMFLDEYEAEELWSPDPPRRTVHGALMPLLGGTGDIASPAMANPRSPLGVLAGDLALSGAEDEFSSQWPQCLDGSERAFRVITALSRVLSRARERAEADLVLIDVGPNLGAINRAALIAADFVVTPLAPDLFSLQGLRNLGPTLRDWRRQWQARLDRAKELASLGDVALPGGAMKPIGYVVLQHAVRLDRPVKAYARWMEAIPGEYRGSVLDEPAAENKTASETDEHCLATLKHYRSLMPYAQEARKPMFKLTAADGALGGHVNAVQDCYWDFRALACAVATRCGVRCPQL